MSVVIVLLVYNIYIILVYLLRTRFKFKNDFGFYDRNKYTQYTQMSYLEEQFLTAVEQHLIRFTMCTYYVRLVRIHDLKGILETHRYPHVNRIVLNPLVLVI